MAKRRRKRKNRRRRMIAYILRLIVFLFAICVIAGIILGGKLLYDKLLAQKDNSITEITANTIIISSKGEITGAIYEEFDETKYNSGELKSMIDEEISAYNAVAGSESAVELSSYQIIDGYADVRMVYESDADYRAFNSEKLYVGTVTELAGKGVLFDKELTAAEGDKSIVAGSVSAIAADKAVAIDSDCNIKLPGKVLYYSPGVKVLDKKEVSVTSGDGLQFVVYK